MQLKLITFLRKNILLTLRPVSRKLWMADPILKEKCPATPSPPPPALFLGYKIELLYALIFSSML